MTRTYIKDLAKHITKEVTVKGWLHNIRIQKNVLFIELRERSGIVQCVLEKEGLQDLFTKISKFPQETILSVTGIAKEFNGKIEVSVTKIDVISKPQGTLPIPVVQKGEDETGLKKRLDYRWIDLRKPEKKLIFEISTYTEMIMRKYLIKRDFISAMTPKIMATPSESKAELFTLSYFGKKAFLAQSAQFYKQMAMSAGFERFFTFADTYREDPSSTIWHVAQFTTLDVEFSFIDSFEDVLQFEEKFIRHVISKIKDKYGELIHKSFGVEVTVPTLPFPRIPMKEALKIIRDQRGSRSTGEDLSTSEEKLLGEYAQKEFGHEFVFVTEFPISVRPFYHMQKDKKVTFSSDLLFKEREIFTSAQREHRYKILTKQAEEKGHDIKKLDHYLEFFKHACPPHGGMGFGFERFIMLLLGLQNIRESVLLPRDMKRIRP